MWVTNMKFRGHETFFIRKGWLYKGLKNVKDCPTVFTDKDINPMDVLGIGANMVKSLRYWMQAVKLTKEPTKGVKSQKFTELADLIWEHDRYMEELGTLWLLHYSLASNEEMATSWFYFFNEFKMSEFRKDDFVFALTNFTNMSYEVEIAQGSLESDFDCLINTYVARGKSNPEKVMPESNIDCPFGELGLIDIVNRKEKIYRKAQPKKNMLHPLIVLSVILNEAQGRNELRIASLLSENNNVGKVFNLDIIALTNYLHQLSQTGYLKVIRTAGLDVVRITTDLDFKECVRAYYTELNQ